MEWKWKSYSIHVYIVNERKCFESFIYNILYGNIRHNLSLPCWRTYNYRWKGYNKFACPFNFFRHTTHRKRNYIEESHSASISTEMSIIIIPKENWVCPANGKWTFCPRHLVPGIMDFQTFGSTALIFICHFIYHLS